MKIIIDDMTLRNFKAWSGAIATKEAILFEGKEDEFEQLVEECYPDGLTDTELNDLLWFDDEWIFEQLDIDMEC